MAVCISLYGKRPPRRYSLFRINYNRGRALLNRIFHEHGHLFIWDFETLAAALLKSDFHDVTKTAFGEGRDDRLLIDTRYREVESLYVEAVA